MDSSSPLLPTPQALTEIRRQIDDLQLPTAAYVGIGINDNEIIICLIDGEHAVITVTRPADTELFSFLADHLRTVTAQRHLKCVAAVILSHTEHYSLGARLWRELDIVPYITIHHGVIETADVEAAAREIVGKFDENNLVKVPLTSRNEVEVAFLVTKDDYESTVPKYAWQYLLAQVEEFKQLGNRLDFFNATPQGGGVALMRHALIRLYRLLDVDAHWHVLPANREVFEITKTKFHNVLQGVAPEETALTELDRRVYTKWSEENASFFADTFRQSRVIVIDDPQPSGLIPFIEQYNSKALIMYRSHIHLDQQLLATLDSPQYHTWEFIWGNASRAAVFVSHPVHEFIPRALVDTTVLMPATTDPLDGLNKPLAAEQMDYYLKLFNKILLEHDQQPLDMSRPYIIQIARFDPSKGIPDVIESYRLLREKLGPDRVVPQLVIVGHGSIDDPDGIPMYNMTLHLLQTSHYAHLASDVKVVRLHHNDQILNALLRGSKVALQLSHKEGFEVKVTEALHKGKPVIAYMTGGIPLQIHDGVTGFLVEAENTAHVATYLYELMTDTVRYQQMSQAATTRLLPDFFTVYNGIKWLYLANRLMKDGPFVGRCRAVRDLISESGGFT